MKLISLLAALVITVALTSSAIASSIWSGYYVTSGTPYKSVGMTWKVPKVAWGQTTYNPYGYEYHWIWIGIGGVGDNTLVQIGTESIVSKAGTQTNYVLYQLYPNTSHSVPYAAGIGDTINSSITCVANCIPGQTQTWKLMIADQTRGWTWSQNFNYASSMGAAEWILESPSYGSILPLNNYGKATFSNLTTNGANPNLTTSNSVVMQTPYGQTSNPSAPINGNAFSTCYGYGSLTPCQ